MIEASITAKWETLEDGTRALRSIGSAVSADDECDHQQMHAAVTTAYSTFVHGLSAVGMLEWRAPDRVPDGLTAD